MTKQIKLLTVMASAVMVFAACSSDKLEAYQGQPDTNLESPSNAISFGTYMGKTGVTRAGAYGSINTTTLQDADYGFGVFAYSTGNTAYSSYRTQDAETGHFPNFMYNEKVTYNDAVGIKDYNRWSYSNIKYWPNEVQNGAVDDQNNNTANDPAQGSNSYGGKVSFFAYAPYATATVSNNEAITGQATTDHDAGTSGIIAISGNGFNGGNSTDVANEKYKYSDPYVQYKISATNNRQVDLLWGTADNSSENVLNETNQVGNDAKDLTCVNAENVAVTTRPDYKVNTDLTKQKTTGTVNFAFKHALAKIGGSSSYANGSDEDAATKTNGLMVVLDLDKDGAETGGALQNYTGGGTPAHTPYNTKVTINEITLNSEKQLTDAGKTALQNNSEIDYNNGTLTHTANLVNTGIFNLATGVWSDYDNSVLISRTQTIVPTVNASTDATKDAILHQNIAEPSSFTSSAYTKARFEELPIGVTTVAKNVYKDEVQPFVFIPGSYPIITISIDYTVRTYDAKLNKAYSEVRQKITKRLYILDEIKLNKQYSILMRLGLTSVKFDATVSDWEVPTNSDVSGSTSTTLTAESEVEHVYLPINVSELTSVTPYDAADATGSIITAATGSQVHSLTLKSLKFDYSDDADDINVNTGNYVAQGVTFTSSNTSYATVSDEGVISFTENASPSPRTVDITVIRGNQTGTFTLTQAAPTLNAISMNFAESTVGTSGGTITPTVTASYVNTDASSNAYAPNVTTSATYEVNNVTATLTSGKLTVGTGTANAPIMVKATYNTKEVTVNDASVLKWE